MGAPAANPRHLALSSVWGTPQPYIDAARQVMGSIDLDPASDADAQVRVRALRYFGIELDGLVQPWDQARTVFLNPPGGLVRPFWSRLVDWSLDDWSRQAIWIGYSLEQLQTLQTSGDGPLDAAEAICIPRKRIAFLQPDGTPRPSPTHANYVAYFGPFKDRFRATFLAFGEVL